MENRSASPKAYDCVYEVERSLFPFGQARILKVRGTPRVGDRDAFSYPEDPTGFSDTDSNLIFNRSVRIWPTPAAESKRGRGSYVIEAESEELVIEGSILPFFAKRPVLKTTLTVQYPKDLNVWVELSLGPDQTDKGTPLPGGNGTTWEFGPLLPGQGFTVRFRRIGVPTAPAISSGREVQA